MDQLPRKSILRSKDGGVGKKREFSSCRPMSDLYLTEVGINGALKVLIKECL